ncbi:MAG TPA: 2-C-methyl-D-erythritol 4-phosphate cytidylyltransferase, partial [Candidatus Syntrophosphaera sp.]|nr:2-C-methyl-D-erythritol 4-phosphate cytidylyltransferase [Candidatus Syntrophosphaera sp.]
IERFPADTRMVYANPPFAPIGDYRRAVNAALDSPIDALPLEKQLAPSSRVTIAFDDPCLPVPLMLSDTRGVVIEELLKIVQKDKAVIPVARLKNTIKSIKGDYIEQTIPRHNLVQVFTPQVFAYRLILAAYERAYQEGYVSTDDSALVEHNGGKVRYKFCSDLNLKITDEVDLFFARQILDNNLI